MSDRYSNPAHEAIMGAQIEVLLPGITPGQAAHLAQWVGEEPNSDAHAILYQLGNGGLDLGTDGQLIVSPEAKAALRGDSVYRDLYHAHGNRPNDRDGYLSLQRYTARFLARTATFPLAVLADSVHVPTHQRARKSNV